LLAAHAWTYWGESLLAMLAMVFASSAVYLVNDLCDLRADREHPHKRRRPLASGALSPVVGAVMAAVLVVGGLAIGWLVSLSVLYVIALYWLLAAVYSAWLKQVAWLDVAVLVGFYLLRLVIGAWAVQRPVSWWLLGFVAAVFLTLAACKRAGELTARGPEARRGYDAGSLRPLLLLALISALAVPVVLVLYSRGSVAAGLYATPLWLAAAAPVLAGWLLRVIHIVRAGGMHHDPIIQAVRDPWAWAALAWTLACYAMALGLWR
jgi:4-hydroxybenzoate polyprenyltransferase